MPNLDPRTLLVTSLLVGFGFAMITLVMRIGLGSIARGLRTWLVGDLLIIGGHAAMAGEVIQLQVLRGLPVLTLSTTMIVAGSGFHWLGVWRHRGGGTSHRCITGLAIGIGVFFCIATFALETTARRSQLFNGSMVLLLSLTAATALPVAKRLWGPRLMTIALTIGIGANVATFFHPPLGDTLIYQRAALGILIGLMMTLLTSSAMLLWLQQELCARLVDTAVTDALTGALNRHGLMPQLQRELMRAGRSHEPVSIVLCDLDHFKKVNDTHGHAAGDAVLKNFVTRARSLLRGGDLVARWGGEEFLFILPKTECAEAVAVVERLRKAQTPVADGLPLVTFSAGVATTSGNADVYRIDELLACADARLYIAKETRNRVIGSVVEGAGCRPGRIVAQALSA